MDAIVHLIVDRLHVGQSNRAVLAYVRAKITRGARYGRRYKADRKRVYRIALRRHAANRRLYIQVTSGAF